MTVSRSISASVRMGILAVVAASLWASAADALVFGKIIRKTTTAWNKGVSAAAKASMTGAFQRIERLERTLATLPGMVRSRIQPHFIGKVGCMVQRDVANALPGGEAKTRQMRAAAACAAGVASRVEGAIAKLIGKLNEPKRDTGILGTLKAGFGKVKDAAKGAAGAVWGAAQTVAKKTWEVMPEGMKDLARKAVDLAKKGFAYVRDRFLEPLKREALQLWEAFKSQAWSMVKDAARALFQEAVDWAETKVPGLKRAIEIISDPAKLAREIGKLERGGEAAMVRRVTDRAWSIAQPFVNKAVAAAVQWLTKKAGEIVSKALGGQLAKAVAKACGSVTAGICSLGEPVFKQLFTRGLNYLMQKVVVPWAHPKISAWAQGPVGEFVRNSVIQPLVARYAPRVIAFIKGRLPRGATGSKGASATSGSRWSRTPPRYREKSPRFTKKPPRWNRNPPRESRKPPRFAKKPPRWSRRPPRYSNKPSRWSRKPPRYSKSRPGRGVGLLGRRPPIYSKRRPVGGRKPQRPRRPAPHREPKSLRKVSKYEKPASYRKTSAYRRPSSYR